MIVETGEGLSNSNSYASILEANTYTNDRGIEPWNDATDNEKASALIRATDYVDTAYLFRSVRATDTQALQNPRHNEDALNLKVKAATIELAVVALTRDLNALPVRGVASKEITAGKVSTKTGYDTVKPSSDPYPHITRILRAIASRIGGGVQVGMMTR